MKWTVFASLICLASLPAPAQTNGPGSALLFNGANSYVSIATTGAVAGTFTVELWANLNDPASLSGLFASRSPGDFSFDFSVRNGNQIHGDIGNGSGWLTTAADSTNYPYATGVWYHLAYVVTPTNYTIYANGTQVGTGSYASNNPVLYDANHHLSIGYDFGYYLNGQIDEVRIWNTARSAAQIQTNLQRSLSGSEPGLMGYWRFDEGSGTTTADSSGHSFTGTLINGPAWVASTAPIGRLAATTIAASGVAPLSATLNGIVFPDYQSAGAWFQYGTTTNYRSMTAVTSISATNTVPVAINSLLPGLAPNTLYHYRLVATNGAGTTLGADSAFTTPTGATTLPASDVTASSATLNGRIFPIAGEIIGAGFNYGATTNYGSSATIANFVASNSAPVAVSIPVSGLSPGATYHYQLVAADTIGGNIGADLAFTTPVFANINAGLPGVADSSVAWGDFDNDGKLDILLTGGASTVLRNLGNGAFSNINVALPGVSSGSVALGDFDNDGKLDILLTGYDSNFNPITQVWRNLGNGAFTNIDAGLPGVWESSVAVGDFDNDGKLDILLTGFTNLVHANGDIYGSGPVTQIWRNLGHGTFSNINAGLPGVAVSSVALGDFDNDGRLDILLTGYTGPAYISQVWRNLGSGVFTNINAGLPGVASGSVAWGDFDNDGKLDLLLTGLDTYNQPLTQVWRNLGNGSFTNINAGLPGVWLGSAAWGDFDNDGKLDILLTGTTNYLVGASGAISQVWRNLGNGIFTNIIAGLPGIWLGSAAWGDFDNDGKLGILLTGADSNYYEFSQVWRNLTPLTNDPPAAPTGLGALVTGNAVSLSWQAASDAQTPSAGLSYNLRLGTTPGGSDIVSPEADSVTGFRRLPQLGNAQECLNAALTNLPLGKIYWSVQAVDTGFAGSPFATAGSFVVNVPILTGPATQITFTSASLNGSVNPSGIDCAALFEWGTTTNFGNATLPLGIGNGTDLVTLSQTLAQLQPGTTYYYRLVVTNLYGAVYGLPQSFRTPTDTPPTLSSFANLSTPENTPTPAIRFTIGDAQTPASNLVVTALSTDSNLVPPANLALGGAGSNRTLTITPGLNQTGLVAIVVSVSDGLASASKAFLLTITASTTPVSPLLKIRRSGTNVVLYWPTNAAGFVLVSRSSLLPATPWTIVTNVPAIVGDQSMVTNSASGPGRYYGLVLSLGAPSLTATRSGRNIVVSWPTSAIGYALQTTTDLDSPVAWTPATNVVAVVGNQYYVTNGLSGGSRFYRLTK